MKFTIPATAEELTSSLSGIERLLTAKHHERAGIVYAWTTPGTGGPRTAQHVVQLSLRQFSEQGITGLRSQQKVREYREAWERTAELLGNADLLDIKPGDMVDLPDELPDWKDPDGIGFGETTRDVDGGRWRPR